MAMTDDNEKAIEKSDSQRIKEILLDIDPKDVIRDARAAGLDVNSISDFQEQTHNHWRINDIANEYVDRTVRWCAASGATAGIGGIATTIALGVGDMSHMAARLYWLCQRLAVLHGFDPDDPLQRDRAQEIYLVSLGIDSLGQAAIRQQLTNTAIIAGKTGSRSNYILKFLILVVAKITGKKASTITTIEVLKFIPLVGAVTGGSLNYYFANKASKKMLEIFRDDYFRTMQASNRQ
jgi:hypothetical protein